MSKINKQKSEHIRTQNKKAISYLIGSKQNIHQHSRSTTATHTHGKQEKEKEKEKEEGKRKPIVQKKHKYQTCAWKSRHAKLIPNKTNIQKSLTDIEGPMENGVRNPK